MDAFLYKPLFLGLVLLLCVVTGVRYLSSPGYVLQMERSGFAVPLVIGLVLVFWIGMRPVSSAFGDTVNYAVEYANMETGLVSMDWHSEWIWQWLMMSCKGTGLSVNVFFTIVEAGYVLSALWAVKRFMPINPMLGMLFVLASLSYYEYGVNGLRNGLACHLAMLAMSFLFDDRYAVASVIALLAFGIHRSIALPVIATLAGMYVIKEPKHAVYFWLFSIVLSLVFGEVMTNFFAGLGFDDRMSHYTSEDNDMSEFSRTGFRWDFLLYSAFPVLMIWFVCVKRVIKDNWYNVIVTTYCLSNAFWVIVIRSSYSNRFAYLSWFLYPIVIAYPLINLPVWEDQDKKTGQILLAYAGFTAFMELIYW